MRPVLTGTAQRWKAALPNRVLSPRHHLPSPSPLTTPALLNAFLKGPRKLSAEVILLTSDGWAFATYPVSAISSHDSNFDQPKLIY